jgi:hypoxanthine phosphoribosyltransferase
MLLSRPMTAQGVRPFISAADIQARVNALGHEIRRDHPDGVHLVGVLKGAFMFMSDLARAIDGNTTLDFIAVSSYGSSTKSSGQVQLLKDLDSTLETLTYLQEILRARSPRHLRTACLLSKPSRRKVEVQVDYVGFTIEDKFVVGYGLDYAEQYRNLPHIGVIGE